MLFALAPILTPTIPSFGFLAFFELSGQQCFFGLDLFAAQTFTDWDEVAGRAKRYEARFAEHFSIHLCVIQAKVAGESVVSYSSTQGYVPMATLRFGFCEY